MATTAMDLKALCKGLSRAESRAAAQLALELTHWRKERIPPNCIRFGVEPDVERWQAVGDAAIVRAMERV